MYQHVDQFEIRTARHRAGIPPTRTAQEDTACVVRSAALVVSLRSYCAELSTRMCDCLSLSVPNVPRFASRRAAPSHAMQVAAVHITSWHIKSRSRA